MMSEGIWEICAGAVILACIVALAYIFTRPKGPVAVQKSTEGGYTLLRIRANRDVSRIEVSSGEGEAGVRMVRAGLRKGEDVVFRFPAVQARARIVVEDGSGSHTIEA